MIQRTIEIVNVWGLSVSVYTHIHPRLHSYTLHIHNIAIVSHPPRTSHTGNTWQALGQCIAHPNSIGLLFNRLSPSALAWHKSSHCVNAQYEHQVWRLDLHNDQRLYFSGCNNPQLSYGSKIGQVWNLSYLISCDLDRAEFKFLT